MSIVCPPFFGSLYWGMLIYFLSLNLLDVAHSYLTCCGGCICCFRFSRFGHSCLHQWLTCCVSGCYTLMRITHRRRWLAILPLLLRRWQSFSMRIQWRATIHCQFRDIWYLRCACICVLVCILCQSYVLRPMRLALVVILFYLRFLR